MKTIKAILIAALIIYGCADVVIDNNYTSQSIKQNPDRRPVLVFDGDSNVYDCDSTIDYRDVSGNWYKVLFQDGGVFIEFPYEYNPKGFKTMKR